VIADVEGMMGGSIAALAVGAAFLVAAAGAAGGDNSTIVRQDAKAESNARNMVSAVESCWSDMQDYSKCRSAAVLNRGMGQYAVPIGTHRGQVRVSRATRTTFTINSWSRSGNHFYFVRKSNGALVRKCTHPGRGLCAHNWRW
jgi:hypothetical protein